LFRTIGSPARPARVEFEYEQHGAVAYFGATTCMTLG
jgi:hypothetical protein